MTNPTDDDPIDKIAEMGERNPAIWGMIAVLGKIAENLSSEEFDAFLDTWEGMPEIQAGPNAAERRAAFRVIQGGG
ncbi:MAG: hypothetical protein IH884_11295 [Myxococcales bacterium]|nr:hypothetical protein [Myxococcales bacterium]